MKVIPVSDRQIPNGSTSSRDEESSSTTSKDDGNKEVGNQQVSCCSSKRAMYHLFDTTVGNFPMGACMGVVCSTVAFGFVASGAEGCHAMLLKYDGVLSTRYLYALVICTLTLHCAVFFHGVAVGVVETSRELYHVREIGCYKGCQDRDTKCGRRCRACQVCGQAGCHVAWAVVGTLLLFLCYAGLVGASIVSSMTTLFSFLFVHACRKYSVLIDDNLQRAYGYLEEAKGHLHRADNVTLQFLNKYNEWMNLQASFRESAMYQLETAAPTTYLEKQPAWAPRSYGRKLYDPRASIASGRSVLATLNQTIAHTEAQIAYYDTQLLASVEFCHDYAGLYDALYLVSVGTFLLLLAHFIVFGAHYKYFTAWWYEQRLMQNQDYD